MIVKVPSRREVRGGIISKIIIVLQRDFITMTRIRGHWILVKRTDFLIHLPPSGQVVPNSQGGTSVKYI